jgi:hypothetical protein
MNRKPPILLLIIGICFLLTASFAQKSADKAGTVTLADLEMTSCSIDTTASAFVMFDIGETSFVAGEGTFDVLYKRTVRIKILRKAGIRHGELIIPLHTTSKGFIKKDAIREFSAFTYNLADGKIVKTKADQKTLFEQKVSDYTFIKKLAFPDVHEGSVLELSYEIRSPFVFRLRDWEFQWEIPVMYSECVLKYTPFLTYAYVLKNAVKFDDYQEYQVEGFAKEFYNTKYKEGAYRFVMKNVPAFTETDYISSNDDYLRTLHFQLNKFTDTRGVAEDQYKTWDELAKNLTEDDDFGKYITSSQSISRQILEVEKFSGLAPAERFNAIVSWVKKNISWNEFERQYAENKPKELLKRKSGSSAEINLFLCGMLQSAGFEAWPVLLSTRGNARVIKDYPFLEFFNYVMVIAKIGDKWVLTDGTEPMCENGSFPVRCINGKGLLVQGDKTSWVDISAKSLSLMDERFRLTFNPGMDSLDARYTVIATGYQALAFRNSIGKDQDRVVKKMFGTSFDAVDSVIIRNAGVDSVMKPYSLSLHGKIPVEMTDGLLVIDPFCNMAISKNPFDKESRKYPVDFIYPKNKALIMELIIPDGYKVRELPQSASKEDNLTAFSYTAQLSENKITVHAFYSLKNAVYTPEEYTKLKQFFGTVVKKLNEKIYLEKTS